MFRRVIAGLILGPALLIGSFAWSGFLALRTVFDEDRSRDVAEELLENEVVRDQIAENLGRAVENALPPEVPITGEQIDLIATAILSDPTVEALILESLGSTHRAFLGDGEAPQEIDLGPALAAAGEITADLPPAVSDRLPDELVVELPTEHIPNASPVSDFLDRTVPILGGVSVVMLLMAFLTTSDRAAVLKRAALWAIGTTAFYLVVGIGIPYLLRSFAPEQAEVVAALLAALLRTTLVPSIVLGGVGAVLLALSIFWPDRSRRPAPAPMPGAVAPAPMPAPGVAAPAPTAPAPPPVEYGPRPSPRPRPASPSPAAPRPAPRPPAATPPAATPFRAPTPDLTEALRPPTPPPATAFRPPAPDPTEAFRSPGDEPPTPSRPTLPTRARPPEPVDLPAWTGEPQESDPAKPRPPRWVEGHGWVMDPDDPREPPSNARHVDGIGWVVPGPPPDNRG